MPTIENNAAAPVAGGCDEQGPRTLAEIGIAGESHAVGRILRLEQALAARDEELAAARSSISEAQAELEATRKLANVWKAAFAESPDEQCAAMEEMNAELAGLRALIPDTPEFDSLAGKTLTECVAALVTAFPYAIQMRAALEGIKDAIANGLKFDGAKWLLFESGRGVLLDMIDAALAKNPAATVDRPGTDTPVGASGSSVAAGPDSALTERVHDDAVLAELLVKYDHLNVYGKHADWKEVAVALGMWLSDHRDSLGRTTPSSGVVTNPGRQEP